jgi:hypothetical protein
LTERQEENREAVAMQARAEKPHCRRGRDHTPAIIKAGKNIDHLPFVCELGCKAEEIDNGELENHKKRFQELSIFN